MGTRALTLLTVGLLLFGAARLTADDKPNKDQEALQGTWKVESFAQDGKEAPADKLKDMTFVFKDNTYKISIGDQEFETGTFQVDASKKPHTIDLDIKSGPDKGKKQPGVYSLEGDTLKVCFAHAGETERPKEVAAKAEKTIYTVLKREKK